MALTPAEPNRDTLRDLLPIWMWDDEKPKPVGAIDHDGWGYIYYGPQYHYNAAMGFVPFNFAQAANAAIANNAQAANAATAPTIIPYCQIKYLIIRYLAIESVRPSTGCSGTCTVNRKTCAGVILRFLVKAPPHQQWPP